MTRKKIDIETVKRTAERSAGIRTGEYGPFDDAGMLSLWQGVFNELEVREQDYFDWQYKDNPAGKAAIYLAKKGQETVGQFVQVPVRAKIGSSMHTGSVSINTLTHPGYRGLGIFFLLTDRAFNNSPKKGLEFVFGVPNKPSFQNSINAGFIHIGRLFPMIKMTSFSNVAIERISFGKSGIFRALLRWAAPLINVLTRIFFMGRPFFRDKSLRVIKADAIDESFDRLWEKASRLHENICVRDSRHLKWRFQKRPKYDYTILAAKRGDDLAGYAALLVFLKKEGKLGVIADMLFLDDSAGGSLINSSLRFFSENNTDMILTMASKHSKLRPLFKRFGFKVCPERFIADPMPVVMRNFSGRIEGDSLHDLKKWYFTFGDFDLY